MLPATLRPSERMKLLQANLYLLLFGASLLLDEIVGQEFLDKYMGAIQNYIMTGEEKGWGKHCDILSAGTHSHEGITRITMGLDKINMLNFKSSSSKCLLVYYDVTSKADLSTLLKFGHAAIKHVRLAFVLKMQSGITLGLATNKSLPFLVAAETSQGKEQFLCPVVGKKEPHLQKVLCQPSGVSYKNKTLRITIMGPPPWMMVENGSMVDGTIARFNTMIAQRYSYTTELIVPKNYIDAYSKVCNPSSKVNALVIWFWK